MRLKTPARPKLPLETRTDERSNHGADAAHRNELAANYRYLVEEHAFGCVRDADRVQFLHQSAEQDRDARPCASHRMMAREAAPAATAVPWTRLSSNCYGTSGHGPLPPSPKHAVPEVGSSSSSLTKGQPP